MAITPWKEQPQQINPNADLVISANHVTAKLISEETI